MERNQRRVNATRALCERVKRQIAAQRAWRAKHSPTIH
jgi:hypothetical protein